MPVAMTPLYWHYPAEPGHTLCGKASTGELVAHSYHSVDCPDCLKRGDPGTASTPACGPLGRLAYQSHAEGRTWKQVGALLVRNGGAVWDAARAYARRERLPWPPVSEAA